MVYPGFFHTEEACFLQNFTNLYILGVFGLIRFMERVGECVVSTFLANLYWKNYC